MAWKRNHPRISPCQLNQTVSWLNIWFIFRKINFNKQAFLDQTQSDDGETTGEQKDVKIESLSESCGNVLSSNYDEINGEISSIFIHMHTYIVYKILSCAGIQSEKKQLAKTILRKMSKESIINIRLTIFKIIFAKFSESSKETWNLILTAD